MSAMGRRAKQSSNPLSKKGTTGYEPKFPATASVSPDNVPKAGLGIVSPESVTSETVTSSSLESVSDSTLKSDTSGSDDSASLFLPKKLSFKLFHKNFPMDELHGLQSNGADIVTHSDGNYVVNPEFRKSFAKKLLFDTFDILNGDYLISDDTGLSDVVDQIGTESLPNFIRFADSRNPTILLTDDQIVDAIVDGAETFYLILTAALKRHFYECIAKLKNDEQSFASVSSTGTIETTPTQNLSKTPTYAILSRETDASTIVTHPSLASITEENPKDSESFSDEDPPVTPVAASTVPLSSMRKSATTWRGHEVNVPRIRSHGRPTPSTSFRPSPYVAAASPSASTHRWSTNVHPTPNISIPCSTG